MYCAISGEIPKEPVVVKTSGILFEKSLIEKVIRTEARCPVTGASLSEEDLLPLQATKLTPARSSAPVSVPGLLHALQQEWDEHVLDAFSLKQQLEATRKELAHALYQHDAACRVIARLMRERDEAHHLLRQFQASSVSLPQQQQHAASVSVAAPVAPTAAAAEEAMDVSEAALSGPAVPEAGVSESVLGELNAVCKALSSTRKGRKVPEQLVSKEAMTSLQETHAFSPHKTGGILSLAVKSAYHYVNNGVEESKTMVLTGGSDKSLMLCDLQGQVACKINGHAGQVTHVAFAPNDSKLLYSASADNSLKVWAPNSAGGFQEHYSFSNVQAPITGIAVHPSANYVVTTTANEQWQLLDVSRQSLLKVVTSKDADDVFHSTAFHPDGLILGTGTASGAFKIWDIREQKNVCQLTGHTGMIKSVSFSENGYYAATGGVDGWVRIWDLRKLNCAKAMDVGPAPVNALSFDHSGVYLGIAGGGKNGKQAQVKVVKEWTASALLPDIHSEDISGIAWAEHASALVTASHDNVVKVFAPKQ